MGASAEIFGAKIDKAMNRDFKISGVGIYIKNEWTKFADKNFPNNSPQKINNGFWIENYQTWTDYYLNFIKRDLGLEDPFTLTVNESKEQYKKKPLWAISFDSKGFQAQKMPSNMYSGRVPKYERNKYWVERELLMPEGKPVLVERLFTVAHTLSELTILRPWGNRNGFEYRHEVWVSLNEFDSGLFRPAIRENLNVNFLLSSCEPILNNIRYDI